YCQKGMTGMTFAGSTFDVSKFARFFGVINKQKAKPGATDLRLFLAINRSKLREKDAILRTYFDEDLDKREEALLRKLTGDVPIAIDILRLKAFSHSC